MGPNYLEEMSEQASRAPHGCFVEIGVWRGDSARRLYEITERESRNLHLFDTFTGIPFQGEGDFHKVGDFGDTVFEDVKLTMPNAVFHVGIFPETLTDDVKDIAFIHFDGDQYQSAKSIKSSLFNRMAKGCIIFIDDFEHLPPVGKAFNEDFPSLPQRTKNGNYYIVIE